MAKISSHRCFLLTHNGLDRNGYFEINLFAVNKEGIPVNIKITNFRPLFFILSSVPAEYTGEAIERKPLQLKTFEGDTVDCLYFSTYSAMKACARKLRDKLQPIYESDIHPVDRFLMERFVKGGFEATGFVEQRENTVYMVNPRIRGVDMVPNLSVLSIDIETNAEKGSIYSIACSGKKNIVFIIGNADNGKSPIHVVYCKNERSLLENFINHLHIENPDVIIGWNVIDFDLKIIYNRCKALGLKFDKVARKGGYASIFKNSAGNKTLVRIDGRVVIDVPLLLRSYYPAFEEYSLDYVAFKITGKNKEITLKGKNKIAAINNLFANDKLSLASYNLNDAALTREIFEKTGLLKNAIERSKLSGHPLDRTGGSIAAFDYLYLPMLHRAGYVAYDAPDPARLNDEPLPGGFVIEPKPGIYDNVLVFDFRSLYPSIIMSFHIDPLARIYPSTDRIRCPAGTSFARSPALLPEIITKLLEARNEAKRNNNPHLSQAVKILMNSFYGVLGARNCRFFSPELASSITRNGQYILKRSIEFIEKTTLLPVIYGDTDSIFVFLGANKDVDPASTGREIAEKTTEWLADHLREQFNTESALLLQFESCFHRFLIPAVRGGGYGSKKHYCGGRYVDGKLELTFKGMESARSDWTDCAKEFQHELIRRIFAGEPVEEHIIKTISDIKAGKADEKLIYRKRLRKKPEDYTQGIPQHVQAAKLLGYAPSVVRYYITVDGPQPVEKLRSPIDYRHYIDCQIQPVADSILCLVGKEFSKIISGQQELFSV